MKRVLVVSYYFPPSGGPGVQRVLKFVRYLPDFGWKPTVITVDPAYASYPALDRSLLDDVPEDIEVIRTRSWDPYQLYARLQGKSKEAVVGVGFVRDSSRSVFQAIARWLRGNVFLPDARRGWVRYAAKAALEAMSKQSFDALLTSGPPHSTHLVAHWIQRKAKVPWVVDMRDPWSDIQYSMEMHQSSAARAIQARMERRVLSSADVVIGVSDYVGELLKVRGRIKRYQTIFNGFDPADIESSPQAGPSDGPFIVAHVGTFNWARHAPGLVAALAGLAGSAELHFVGHVHERVVKAFRTAGCTVVIVPYMPHQDAVAYMQHADMLLVYVDHGPRNRGIVTGKVFEYVSLGRPVLGVGPVDGDLTQILAHTNTGRVFDYEDAAGIDAYIRRYMDCRGQPLMVNQRAIQSYERRELTRSLANILDSLA
ncbi:MAG: glycosyltransferase family 4 protein [Bacteroidota bacterium]|nr:glycosyltransferase family 4 protein [Bacteroidota bacterium]